MNIAPSETTPVESILLNSPELALNRGVILEVTQAERCQGSDIDAGDLIQKVFIEAVPLKGKEELTTEPYILRGRMGATVVTGGQDASGAEVFNSGRVQCALVSADGCSFGGKKDSAEAARVAAESCLYGARTIANDPTLNRDNILDKAKGLLSSANDRIKKEIGPGGAATAVVAIIGKEKTGNGDVYLYVSACGDPQVTILSTDTTGQTKVRRLVTPADLADKTLRTRHFDPESATPRQVEEARKELVAEKAEVLGLDETTVNGMLTESGLYSFLGGNPNDKNNIRVFRMNLTADLKGHTDVLVCTSSDNFGQKIDTRVIAGVYEATRNSGISTFVKGMDEIMSRRNEDDGTLAVAKISV